MGALPHPFGRLPPAFHRKALIDRQEDEIRLIAFGRTHAYQLFSQGVRSGDQHLLSGSEATHRECCQPARRQNRLLG